MRYYATGLGTYDLGVNMENGWLVFHTNWTVYTFLYTLTVDGGFILLSPFTLPGSYQLLIILQILGVSLSAFAVYGIALYAFRSRLPSLLVSLSFLLFPFSPAWFPFHFDPFLMPFFLFGYLLFLHRMYIPATLLFLAAALVRFPYGLFVALFAVVAIIELAINPESPLRRRDWQSARLLSLAVILVVSSAVTVTGYYLVSTSVGVGGYFAQGSASVQNIPLGLDNKVFTVLLFAIPLLALPFTSKRFGLFLIPGLFIVFFYNSTAYTYPGLFLDQYSVSIYMFAFLGTIDVLGDLSLVKKRDAETTRDLRVPRASPRIGWGDQGTFRTACAILAVTCLVAIVYTPYGPLNQYTAEDYDSPALTSVNMTVFNAIQKLSTLIPPSVPENDILITGNIVAIFPRPDALGLDPSNPLFGALEVDYNYNFYYNFTRITASGSYVPVEPEYILADTNSWTYPLEDGPYPHNISTYDYVSHFYQSGAYGIIGECAGVILLEKGYHGELILYEPFTAHYTTLSQLTNNSFQHASAIQGSNLTSSWIWHGPWLSMSPGRYNVTYMLMTSNTSANNRLEVLLTADYGEIWLGRWYVNGSQFNRANEWQGFTFDTYVNNTYSDFEVPGWSSYWSGSIYVKSVNIEEVSPPTPIFTAV